MSPSGAGRPISPRLLNQLAITLRAVEEARRSPAERQESLGTALDDLDALTELVAGVDEGGLPDGVAAALETARKALEADDAEGARDALVGVGRSIDDHLRGT